MSGKRSTEATPNPRVGPEPAAKRLPLPKVHAAAEQNRVGALEGHTMPGEGEGQDRSKKGNEAKEDGDRRAQGEVGAVVFTDCTSSQWSPFDPCTLRPESSSTF